MNFKYQKDKGFVALFTVLLVSVILAMAVGIASISLKEIVLSSSASEGNKAFYAADSGIECALYFDKINLVPGTLLQSLVCNGNNYILVDGFPDPGPTSNSLTDEVYNFAIPFGANDELCADIQVERAIIGEVFSTRIESKGSNVACDDDSNPKKVERSIRVTY
ncbi:MAG: hypothetical protein QG580_46 [Patescibacteria group bacterium]|jgi:hypothetical protein|nr:hypothetical protein [Patescibacteria group bacterium]